MWSYLNLVKEVFYAPYKGNRTGIKTRAISGYMLQHDMSEGFPLLTTKKMPLKIIAVELEGFIKGITDKRWFQERGCKIWDEWASPMKVPYGHDEETKKRMKDEPDLGPIYGRNWRNFDGWYKPQPSIKTPFSRKVVVDDSQNNHHLVGNEYQSNRCGSFIVIKEYNVGKELFFDIQFKETGYIKKGVRKVNIIKTKELYDPYAATVYGVACTGELPDNLDKNLLKKIRITWEGMLSRCYNPNDRCYRIYGEKGVYVADDWLVLSNFVKDFSSIAGYEKKIKNWKKYTLDKDCSGQGYYSLSTCCFLDKKEQIRYSELIDKNINKNLYRTGTDQLADLVNKLHTNPLDRRMIVSAWNPNQLHEMALPPCHLMFQVVVTGENADILNLNWVQRSCDLMLGIPFNIASYAMLLLLLATEAGMKPGKLCGMLGDVHIYENHMKGAVEQLMRDPLPLPTLEFPGFKGFFDWDHTQRKLNNYQSHPKIEFPIAV